MRKIERFETNACADAFDKDVDINTGKDNVTTCQEIKHPFKSSFAKFAWKFLALESIFDYESDKERSTRRRLLPSTTFFVQKTRLTTARQQQACMGVPVFKFRIAAARTDGQLSVSYTHLTLPTIYSV